MIEKLKEFWDSYIIIPVIIIILLCIFCIYYEISTSKIDNSQSIKLQDTYMDVVEFEYDKHEYILFKRDRGVGDSRDSYSGVVHKENCKYCKE